MARITRQIKFTEDMWERIKEKAEKRGISGNNWIISLVSNHLDGAIITGQCTECGEEHNVVIEKCLSCTRLGTLEEAVKELREEVLNGKNS